MTPVGRPRWPARWRPPSTPGFAVLVATLALAPLIFAWVTSLRLGWTPEGDDAQIVLKTMDVWSSHFPLQGMRSTSGNAGADFAAHHLGPLEFYLLAIPAALGGYAPWSITLGVVLIAAITSLVTIYWLHRLGGPLLSFAGAVAIGLVIWGLGTEAATRPLNPYPGTLPTLLMLVTLWALLAREPGALAPFAAATALTAQANLAYLPLVGVTVVVAAVVGLRRWRADRGTTWPLRGWAPPPSPRRRSRRAWLAAILLLAWAPVALETVRYRPTNLGQVLRYALFSDVDRQGPLMGLLQALALVAPVPGGFGRIDVWFVFTRSPLAGMVGLVLAVALALSWRRLRHRTDRRSRRQVAGVKAALTGIVALGATLSGLPTSGLLATYWMTPGLAVAAMVWLALVMLLPPRLHTLLPDDRVGLLRGAAVASVVVVALALTTIRPEPTAYAARASLADGVRRAAAQIPPGEPVVVLADGKLSWWSWAAQAAYELRREGRTVYYGDPWNYPEDVDFRYAPAAPAGTVRLIVRDGTKATDATLGSPITVPMPGAETPQGTLLWQRG